jgi:opacity protein-like surface antigen
MRKALIGILLAAAAATPAFAQDDSSREQRWQQRFEQNQARNQARSEQRSQRQEPRQEVREVRQESREAVRTQRQEQRQARREGGFEGVLDGAQRAERQQQMEARQQAAAAAQAEAQAQGRNWQERRGDAQRQNGYPDGWNNVDPNDRRAVRARDRYLAQERENRRDAREDRERREWRDHRRAERRWDRYQWRNDRRYDWYSYRNNYRDLYRGGRYYDPYGYGYRRFHVGIQIGSPFYSSRYRIHDPYRYRLPHAGPGYAWVRYYNDVLLVDTWNGEVVDVIYDFFW